MHSLTNERYSAEPEEMSQLEDIQSLALKILFSNNSLELEAAQQEWEEKNYSSLFQTLTAHPSTPNGINSIWRKKSEAIATSYQERPVRVFDEKVITLLRNHTKDLVQGQNIFLEPETEWNESLDITRRVMAERIFHYELNHDIIALQEANYLDSSLFRPPKPAQIYSHLNKSIQCFG